MDMGFDELGVKEVHGLSAAILVHAVGNPNHLAGGPRVVVSADGNGVAEKLEHFPWGETDHLKPAVEALGSGIQGQTQRGQLREVEHPSGLAVDGAGVELNDEVPTGTGVIQATLGDFALLADSRNARHG